MITAEHLRDYLVKLSEKNPLAPVIFCFIDENGDKHGCDLDFLDLISSTDSILISLSESPTEFVEREMFFSWLDKNLPKFLDTKDRKFNRIINALVKHENGAKTRQHNSLKTFANYSDEEIRKIRNLGKGCIPHVMALRNLAKEEIEDYDDKKCIPF